MKKFCNRCKYFSPEKPQYFNKKFLGRGYCFLDVLNPKYTYDHDVCDDWENGLPKEAQELIKIYKWLNRKNPDFVIDCETQRRIDADIIYTITYKETNNSIRVCKHYEEIYDILFINGIDVRGRYKGYSSLIKKIFDLVENFHKKICNKNEEEQIQEAIKKYEKSK